MKRKKIVKFVYISIRQLYCCDITDISTVPPGRAAYKNLTRTLKNHSSWLDYHCHCVHKCSTVGLSSVCIAPVFVPKVENLARGRMCQKSKMARGRMCQKSKIWRGGGCAKSRKSGGGDVPKVKNLARGRMCQKSKIWWGGGCAKSQKLARGRMCQKLKLASKELKHQGDALRKTIPKNLGSIWVLTFYFLKPQDSFGRFV